MISLLTTDPTIANWFQKDYPFVHISDCATEELFQAEALILTEMYRVGNQYYEIQSLWEYSLAITAPHKKLLTLGWSFPSKGNYLGISGMPEDLLVFINEALPIKCLRKLDYFFSTTQCPSKDKPLRDSLDKYLKSHSRNNLQDLLMQGKYRFGEFEALLRKGERLEDLLQKQSGEDIWEVYLRLNRLWEKALPYFQLIPQFPKIQKFMGIKHRMKALLEGKNGEKDEKSIPISLQIIQYLDENLTFITDHYQFN